MTSLSDSLRAIRSGTRTVPADRALLAAQVALQAIGVDPKRASAVTREQDAVLARYVIAGVLYRFCRLSYVQVGRKLRCGKATAQARISAFERHPERDTILKAAKGALGKLTS